MGTINIREDTARNIALLAAKRQMSSQALINEILDQYIVGQSLAQEQSGTAFLLSIAGMFDSGPGDTSEHVPAIVANAILQKHQGILHEKNIGR